MLAGNGSGSGSNGNGGNGNSNRNGICGVSKLMFKDSSEPELFSLNNN